MDADEIKKIYLELRRRQIAVFRSRTEKEAEEQRKEALRFVTENLYNILKKEGFDEEELLNPEKSSGKESGQDPEFKEFKTKILEMAARLGRRDEKLWRTLYV